MKLLIAGIATALLATAAPVWADNGAAHGWRDHGSMQTVRHWDNRWERDHRHSPRHYDRHHNRHWDRRYERYDRHYYPWHRDYYARDYTHGYSAVEPPSVWFSWSVR